MTTLTVAHVRNVMRVADRGRPETNYGWKLPLPPAALGLSAPLVAGLPVSSAAPSSAAAIQQ